LKSNEKNIFKNKKLIAVEIEGLGFIIFRQIIPQVLLTASLGWFD
jgi:hypothetical protein